jgi:hypothetical protein
MKISDLIDNKTITDVSMAELINLSGIEGSEDSSSKINLFDLFDVYSGVIVVKSSDDIPQIMFANWANTKCAPNIYYDGPNANHIKSILSDNSSEMKLYVSSLANIIWETDNFKRYYNNSPSNLDCSMNFGNMYNMYFISNPCPAFGRNYIPTNAITSFKYTKSSSSSPTTYYYIDYDKGNIRPYTENYIYDYVDEPLDGPLVYKVEPENLNNKVTMYFDSFSSGYSADDAQMSGSGFILIPKKTNGLFTRKHYGEIVTNFSLSINDCIDEYAAKYPGFAHKYTSLDDISKADQNTPVSTKLYLDYLLKNFFDLISDRTISDDYSYYEVLK